MAAGEVADYYYYYYYYAAFNAICVGRKDDESQAHENSLDVCFLGGLGNSYNES